MKVGQGPFRADIGELRNEPTTKTAYSQIGPTSQAWTGPAYKASIHNFSREQAPGL